jgi:hypothetical protein
MTRGSTATDVRRPYARGPRGRHVGEAGRVRARERGDVSVGAHFISCNTFQKCKTRNFQTKVENLQIRKL